MSQAVPKRVGVRRPLVTLSVAIATGVIVGLLALFKGAITGSEDRLMEPGTLALVQFGVVAVGTIAVLCLTFGAIRSTFQRVARSRGARKFRRNKLAMASLVIILAYALTAIWIAAINVINDVGEESGLYSLDGKPIVGLLLRDEIFRPVGPKEMPGFGLTPKRTARLAAYDEYLAVADRAFMAVDQLNADSDQSPTEAMQEIAWRTRPFADRPVEELRAFYEDAARERDALVESRLAVSGLQALDPLEAELRASREAFEAADPAGDPDQIITLLEEVAFDLEAFGERVLAYTATASEDDPIKLQKPEEITDQAGELLDVVDELYDAEPDEVPGLMRGLTLYDPDRVRAILDARADAEETVLRHVDSRIDSLELKVETLFPEPSGADGFVYAFQTFLGTDKQGRSILVRAIYSAKVAIQVGLVTALLAVAFGGVFGAAAAYYGGWVDHFFNWVYSTVTSIPYLVLLAVLSFLFLGSKFEGTLVPLYAAFGLTFWVGPARVVRGEAMKIKELEYVQAATAIGFGKLYILLRHVIPNTSHLLFINFSLLFIGAIKGEVILTFLGLGIKNGASWGLMIDHSKTQVLDQFFWQIGAATFFMFLLVLAFNIFTDALQDAFDPKHVS